MSDVGETKSKAQAGGHNRSTVEAQPIRVLARAMWSGQTRLKHAGKTPDERKGRKTEDRQQFRENRRVLLTQARSILRALDKSGYEIKPKA